MRTLTNIIAFASLTVLAMACGTSDMSSGRDGFLDELGTDSESASGAGIAPGTEEGGAAGGAEGTFDHPAAIGGAAVTAREALGRMAEEGPPGYTARTHSCRKMRYQTLGGVLAGLGVDVSSSTASAAGMLYRGSDQALGAPNYAARIGERTDVTVAVASRTFDIFVSAAPEIIANLPTVERCMVGGVGANVFDAAGGCDVDGLSCLLGEPASAAEVAFCNDFVGRGATVDEGRAIAVAAILSAAHTCE